jgi:dimethylamine monooxygenase subunit A
MREQARYFPVLPSPLKMVAGLRRLGVDCGQGELDQRFFHVDDRRAHYVAAKRRVPANRHGLFGTEPAHAVAREAALQWMRSTLADEQPALLAEAERDHEARDEFDALARVLQEDFAVLSAGDDDAGSTVVLDVRFPSGWRPECLIGASFEALHRPVPGFVETPAAVRSMVRAMIERGPYVRFVWTLCGDDQLDHHPEARRPVDFATADRLWLRVERQVTVALPHAEASVFLIRTYLYPTDELSREERAVVLRALELMPSEVRAYKGLPLRAQVERLLAD